MSAVGGKADIPDTPHQCPLMTHTGCRSDFVSIIAQAISLGVCHGFERLRLRGGARDEFHLATYPPQNMK